MRRAKAVLDGLVRHFKSVCHAAGALPGVPDWPHWFRRRRGLPRVLAAMVRLTAWPAIMSTAAASVRASIEDDRIAANYLSSNNTGPTVLSLHSRNGRIAVSTLDLQMKLRTG